MCSVLHNTDWKSSFKQTYINSLHLKIFTQTNVTFTDKIM